jgi:hypothetical protein
VRVSDFCFFDVLLIVYSLEERGAGPDGLKSDQAHYPKCRIAQEGLSSRDQARD